MDSGDMQNLTARTEKLIDAISGAILATVEVAAERISLAAEAARVAQRMTAFGAVLEAIGAQKAQLLGRLEGAEGPMRALVHRQVELLTIQEVAVLERAGVAPAIARQALAAVDGVSGDTGGADAIDDGVAGTHRRDGRRFVKVNGAGAAGTNGGGVQW